MTRTPAAVACALLLAACGSDQSARPTPTPTADRTALVRGANAICKQAQPAMDRAGKAIDTSDTRAENRKGWVDRYEVMTGSFTKLRALKENGADKAYDAFLAKWGQVLGLNDELGRALGRGASSEELNSIFDALQRTASELVDVAIAAEVLDCAAPYAPGGDPVSGDAEAS